MKRTILFSLIIISLPVILVAQQRTHLPYSIYGLGDLMPKGFTHNMAMGRTGIALSSPAYLNNVNPASYHSIDSISFFFDFGLFGNFVKYRTSSNPSQYGKDVNISNLAIGFGITKKWSSGIGLAPFSTVGYKIQTRKPITGSPNEFYDLQVTGNGGLNQFYWNNSYELFNHLSLGVNVTYLFGSIESVETTSANLSSRDILLKETAYLKKLYADFGVQWDFSPGKKWDMTLGAIFGPEHKINRSSTFSISDASETVTEEEVTDEGTMKFPMYAGGGLAAVYNKSFTVSMDYIFRDWSAISQDEDNFSYISNNTFRLGLQLVPGRFSQLGYFGGVAYRLGAYYEESYLKINNRLIPDYGITGGLGLPFFQNRTSLNISYNYGIKGTLENHLVKEKYHSVMFSLTMHDWWFIKRKID